MKRRTNRSWMILLSLSLFLCLSCGAAFALTQVTAPSVLTSGYITQFCAGLQPQPFKIGFWWALPYISALPPHYVPSSVCAWVPWFPVLPPIGGFGFPP